MVMEDRLRLPSRLPMFWECWQSGVVIVGLNCPGRKVEITICKAFLLIQYARECFHWEISKERPLCTTTAKICWDSFFLTMYDDFLCHHSKWVGVDHFWRIVEDSISIGQVVLTPNLLIEGQASVLEELSCCWSFNRRWDNGAFTIKGWEGAQN